MTTSLRSIARTLAIPIALAGLSPLVLHAQSRPSPMVTPEGILQSVRPLPGSVYESPAFTRAVQKGTRTRTGAPGPRSWVQHARYRIEASLDPVSNTVRGSEHVVYLNNSPDTLSQILVHLRQNVFRPGSERHDGSAPVTNGMSLTRVAVAGAVMDSATALPVRRGRAGRGTTAAGYVVSGTVMRIPLRVALLPHDSVGLDFAWSYNPALTPSDGREGRDEHLYFMGYWYPQIAVYDDVEGWVADQYILSVEFYMDPADYDVTVTVPRGWVVGATGTLLNASSILSADARARLAEARRSGSVVTISRPENASATFATSSPLVTWHFTAPNLRDFAWGTSDRYVWDATRALVSDSGMTMDTVDIYSFYRIHPPASAWAIGGARYTRDAIEQLSKYLWKYPWPTMTSMEGVLTGGGMEYPRMTLMQPWADTLSLAGDLMHETGHMWFPMMVGSNESRYPWMDEGLTQYDEAQGLRPLYGEPRKGGRIADTEQGQRLLYTHVATAGGDLPLMTRGDLFPAETYNILVYDKTAQVLAALRGMVGEPIFHRAFRAYGQQWVNRHPYPEDFFNAMDAGIGQNLSWFWSTWFYNAWPLDQAIANVATDGNTTSITIEDRGLAPMPVTLAVTRADGTTQRINVPVDVWLKGARTYVERVASAPAVVKVEIDPDGLFPDINRGNQTWTRH
ncbi:MAG: M1 family metallopeptidase [Gemmatimonadota bacterium]|nr:M1 family metallopeptidase [Gemmatimonadota bacterium]